VPNLFQYSGEMWDETAGLQYLRARWYDPSIGRFMNEDTYEGSLTNPLSQNLYTYVGNNPLIYTDPSGHCRAGVDAGCYVDSNSPASELLSDPFLTNNSEQYKQLQAYKEQYCTDAACRNKITAKQKILVASSDEYRNSACLYVDCMNGRAEFTGWDNGLPVITQDTNDGIVKYNLAPIGAVQCNCFTAGTKVQTDEGEKPIEEIQVGDKVLSKNDVSGEIAYKEVIELYKREVAETYNISVHGEVITTTDEHPFWVLNKGWIKTKDLSVGDILVTSQNEEWPIEKIEVTQGNKTVYNFMVKDFHTYFVSDIKIWTHNSCSVRVGRWMSPAEYTEMVNTGIVQESWSSQTYVANPADPEAFRKQAKPGAVYVEFNVPASSLKQTLEGWARIIGPKSIEARAAARKGLPIPAMPPATNIVLVEGEK